jgi:hypothetical protein
VNTTTTITSDAPDPSNPGEQITVNFTVTASAGTPTGTVQVTDPMGGGCNASVAAGSCQYTPGGTGLRTITATYGGSPGFSGSSDTEDHTVNQPPTGNPDSYMSTRSAELRIEAAQGVLVNDTDPDLGTTLTAVPTGTRRSANGVVNLNSDGSFQYSADPGFMGISDTFTYRASDGIAESPEVTVTINFTGLRLK